MPVIFMLFLNILLCLVHSYLIIRDTYLPSFARAEHGAKQVAYIISHKYRESDIKSICSRCDSTRR